MPASRTASSGALGVWTTIKARSDTLLKGENLMIPIFEQGSGNGVGHSFCSFLERFEQIVERIKTARGRRPLPLSSTTSRIDH
jgi:hypothetical protein